MSGVGVHVHDNGSVNANVKASALSLPNLKANELLGRRISLVDLIDAELRALARVRTAGTPLSAIQPPGTQSH